MVALKSIFTKLSDAKIIAKKIPKYTLSDLIKIMDYLVESPNNIDLLEEALKGPGNKNMLKVIESELRGGKSKDGEESEAEEPEKKETPVKSSNKKSQKLDTGKMAKEK